MIEFINLTEVTDSLDNPITNEGVLPNDESWEVNSLNELGSTFSKDEEWPLENFQVQPEKIESNAFLPVNNGEWSGDVGDSEWNPNDEYVPLKSNPDELTWGEIKEKYDIDGIPFNEGEPDFSEVSKAEVKIDDFSTQRSVNFFQADEQLSKEWNCTPREAANWRKENNYTWHECKDCQTLQLVPSEVHNNIPHEGGISVAKKAANYS